MAGSDWRDVDRDELRRDAALGKPYAMHNLGVLAYYDGDATAAMDWELQAARRGFAPAMGNLAVALSSLGRHEEAEAWQLAATMNGDPEAMFELAILYNSRGIDDLGSFWRKKAAEAGFDISASDRGVPDDVNERFLRDGLPRHRDAGSY